MRNTFDLLFLGDSTVDVLGLVPTYKDDGWNFFDDGMAVEVAPGGGALNPACVARSLGASVVLYSKIGIDFLGDYLIDFLDSKGVYTNFIKRSTKYSTAVLLVAIDDQGERHFTGFRGANNLTTNDDLPFEALNNCRCTFFMGASFRPESIRGHFLGFMRAAKEKVEIVAIDALYPPGTPIDLVEETLKQSDIVMMNESELYSVTDTNQFDIACQSIKRICTGAVAIKRGSQGAVLLVDGEEITVPARKVEVIDTTGAGDAFNAALLYSRLQGRSWNESLKNANIAGSLAVQNIGGSSDLPILTELERIN